MPFSLVAASRLPAQGDQGSSTRERRRGIYVSFDYGATWPPLQIDKQKGDAYLFRPTTLYSNLPAERSQYSTCRPAEGDSNCTPRRER